MLKNILIRVSFVLLAVFGFLQPVFSQEARLVKLDFIQDIQQKDNDTTYVVNFWATWCRPCVAELPYFMELEASQKGKPFRMILVSLDFPEDLDSKVNRFLERKGYTTECVVLDEAKAHIWIPKVTDDWDGAIPATMVVNGKAGRNDFYAQSFESFEELISTLKITE